MIGPSCLMKIRSMKDEELGNMWFGSFTNCCKLYDEVRTSSWKHSGVLVSQGNHDLDCIHQVEL